MTCILDTDFSWGVGIEDTFIPQTRPGFRALDEYELTAHYRFWREDFDLMRELGVTHVRWGIPWYRVNPAPGEFDWRWIDEALDYLVNVLHVNPIIDLMHYGAPLWLENAFINSEYPQRVAEYACAFAARYKDLVHDYTPLNEPMVNALFCGRRGEWPPYLEGDDGYVKVLLAVVRGVALTAEALRAIDSRAVIVQVEAIEHHWATDERLRARAAEEQAQIYLPFDLFTGRVTEAHPLWRYLERHGVTTADLQWFHEHAIRVDVLGVNFYPVSGGEWSMGTDGNPHLTRGVTCDHLRQVLYETWSRYQLPMLLTETGWLGSVPERKRWMDDSIRAVREVRDAGVPMRGYTWWPLFDMIDWQYRIARGPLRKYLIPGGLWASKFRTLAKIRREPTGLVEHYRRHIQANLSANPLQKVPHESGIS